MNIGLNIKKFRKKLGLQANKLAEQLGISPSYLNLIESGKRNIDGDLLIKICNELRIELADLSSEKEINLNKSINKSIDNFNNIKEKHKEKLTQEEMMYIDVALEELADLKN